MSLLLLLNGTKVTTSPYNGARASAGFYTYPDEIEQKETIQSRIRKDDDEIFEIIIQAFLME